MNNNDQTLPTDPEEAARLLDQLKTKDPVLCQYPTCNEFRRSSKGNKAALYCGNPKHNYTSYPRAISKLKDIAAGKTVDPTISFGPPANTTMTLSLLDDVMKTILRLQSNLSSFLQAITELTDPGIVAVQIESANDRADARIADAQQQVSAEKSLRLEADAARVAAQSDARAARESAELARQELEEIQERNTRLIEQTQQQILDVQSERDTSLEQMRTEMQRTIKMIEDQAQQAIMIAENKVTEAQKDARLAEAKATDAYEEVRRAETRAHDMESEMRIKVDNAEQRVDIALADIQRERSEIDRLRNEATIITAEARERAETDRLEIHQLRETIATMTADARTRAESDRLEINRLRTDSATITADARARAESDRVILDRERAESEHLRAEVVTMRTQLEQVTIRADQLALTNDHLRAQLE